MKEFRYVIVGNSAAGVMGAEAIREADAQGTLAIISDEPYHTYSRALIGHYLSGQVPFERMRYRPEDFYEKWAVTPMLGRRVTSLDVKKRRLVLDGKETLAYGDCLLTTGGKPFLPRIEGLGLKGVTPFISLDDAKRLDGLLAGANNVVVIGGGLIGMQAAEALRHRNVAVTIVELLPRVLGLVLDEGASRIVEDIFREQGTAIVTGRSAQAVLPRRDDATRVGSVRLDNGEQLPADVVVVAIGVVPRLELLEGTGVKTNRGIVVNKNMRTSAPHLYAAGDAVEVRDFILETDRTIPIWPSATIGGRTAGLNMAGKKVEFPGVTGMNAADFFGFPVISAGIVNPKPEEKMEILTRQAPDKRRLAKLVLKDNRIRGMVFTGDAVDRAGVYYGLMRDAVDVGPFRETLLEETFSFMAMPDALRRARIA